MAHLTERRPDLKQVNNELQLGNSSNGTVLKSESEGVIKVLMQDKLTAAKLKIAVGVDADDAVAMEQLNAANQAIADLQALVASDDTDLDQLQEIVDFIKNNRGDIDTLTTNLQTQIAAVQADVDQNELDSDAADAALATRATALEAFETLFKAGITITADGSDWDVYLDKDLYINNGALLVGNATIISAGRELKNIASVDSATDTVLSATSIAHTDALAAKHAIRYKQVLHSSSASAYFGSIIKTDMFVTEVVVKVNTAFDNNATLSIGDDNDLTLFGDLVAADMSSVGVYSLPVVMKMTADKQPKYTISGSPTQGDLEIFLKVSA